MKGKKRKLVILMSMVLVALCAVGGTLAYLTAKTEEVKNTFTVGNIDIELTESVSPTNYKMVPGNTIEKDPAITVAGGSEDCWLFVKVDESANLKDYIEYEIADGWIALGEQYPGIYYMEVYESSENQKFNVLDGSIVTVRSEVTKEMMDSIKNESNNPTLTFTGYAVQKANIASAAEAWQAVGGQALQ